MDFTGTFADTQALVIGASGALGSRIAERLAAGGAGLTLVGRRRDALDAVANSAPDGHVRRIVADLRDPMAVDDVAQAAAEPTGQIDVVVNAMGIVAFGEVATLDSDVVEELFLTNAFSAMFLSKAVLRSMSAGGTIASISGVIAEQNMPGMAAYGASKAALRSFNEGFAREARRKKVRVLDVRPPHTETGLVGRAIAGTAPNFAAGLDPEDVADTIASALANNAVTDLPASAFR